MYKVILILDDCLLKYEGGKLAPQKKTLSKNPDLLGLRIKINRWKSEAIWQLWSNDKVQIPTNKPSTFHVSTWNTRGFFAEDIPEKTPSTLRESLRRRGLQQCGTFRLCKICTFQIFFVVVRAHPNYCLSFKMKH